ncbi:hypothetical protein As57867_014621, partial [Aphanomyces stellatus]
ATSTHLSRQPQSRTLAIARCCVGTTVVHKPPVSKFEDVWWPLAWHDNITAIHFDGVQPPPSIATLEKLASELAGRWARLCGTFFEHLATSNITSLVLVPDQSTALTATLLTHVTKWLHVVPVRPFHLTRLHLYRVDNQGCEKLFCNALASCRPLINIRWSIDQIDRLVRPCEVFAYLRHFYVAFSNFPSSLESFSCDGLDHLESLTIVTESPTNLDGAWQSHCFDIVWYSPALEKLELYGVGVFHEQLMEDVCVSLARSHVLWFKYDWGTSPLWYYENLPDGSHAGRNSVSWSHCRSMDELEAQALGKGLMASTITNFSGWCVTDSFLAGIAPSLVHWKLDTMTNQYDNHLSLEHLQLVSRLAGQSTAQDAFAFDLLHWKPRCYRIGASASSQCDSFATFG